MRVHGWLPLFTVLALGCTDFPAAAVADSSRPGDDAAMIDDAGVSPDAQRPTRDATLTDGTAAIEDARPADDDMAGMDQGASDAPQPDGAADGDAGRADAIIPADLGERVDGTDVGADTDVDGRVDLSGEVGPDVAPDFEPDAEVAEADGPELDSATPEADSAAPELDSAAPDGAPDMAAPELDSAAPGADSAAPDGAPDMAVPMPEVCNGFDDDLDLETDEVVAVERLLVTFGPTVMHEDWTFLHVLDRAGEPIGGSPFTGVELFEQTVPVEGNVVQLRFVSLEGATPTVGFSVTRIEDQTAREYDGALPESAREGEDRLHAVPTDEAFTVEMADTLGLGTTCGDCGDGLWACVDGQERCEGARIPLPETCDGVDNDCDGVVDNPEALRAQAAACARTEGVCAGTVQPCRDGAWRACGVDIYGDDFRLADLDCDCLDNNCDGLVDGNRDGGGDVLAGCRLDDFDEIARGARDRVCTAQQSSMPQTDTYTFAGGLTVSQGVSIEAPAGADGVLCGFSGGLPPLWGELEPNRGGGCITLAVMDVLRIEGEIRADGGEGLSAAGNFGGGASGGAIVLAADEIRIAASGRVHANGGDVHERSVLGPSGGGAAGRVVLNGRIIEVAGEVVAVGGAAARFEDRGHLNEPGFGAGGPGGRGWGGGGGGGSRGPGAQNGVAGAGEDPAGPWGRSMAAAGQLTILGAGVFGTYTGPSWADSRRITAASVVDGNALFYGEAVSARHQVASSRERVVEMLFRVDDAEGRWVEGAPVSVVDAELGLELVEASPTNVYGQVGASVRFGDEDYRILVGPPADAEHRVLLSYGDEGGRGCTVMLALDGDPLGADVPDVCLELP